MQIEVNIHDTEVKKLLSRLERNTGNLIPAMRDIGEIIRRSVRKNFKVGGRPNRWQPSARAKRDGGQTLVKSSILKNSFTVEAGANSVSVGTNVKYAAIHQFGGRTPPHVIRPKTKKALFWPGAGHPVKSVKHPGSKMPKRPFLMVQNEDWPRIKSAIIAHVMRD